MMAKLTTKKRNALPKSAFAIPETESYPIHDEAHARNALARVSANGTAEEKRRVRAAVHSRYPQIDMNKHLFGAGD
jgi:hypothetical protein